jgi:hypothetical protein
VRHRQDLLRLVDLASLDQPPWHWLVWCRLLREVPWLADRWTKTHRDSQAGRR